MTGGIRCLAGSMHPRVLLCIALTCLTNSAPADSPPKFEVVQASDTSVLGARLLSELVDGRYVLAEEKTVFTPGRNKRREGSFRTYAFDCKEPKRVALVVDRYNLELRADAEPNWGGGLQPGVPDNFHPRDLEYLTLDAYNERWNNAMKQAVGDRWVPTAPDSATIAADFACRAARRQGAPDHVAEDLRKNGGVADLKELICQLILRDQEVQYVVRFSEGRRLVQVNDLWKSQPGVDKMQVRFTDGELQGRIDRTTGRLTISAPDSPSYSRSGQCELASTVKRKF